MNQSTPPSNKPNAAQYVQSMAFVSVGGQVGCLTLVIVFVALFGGLALDRIFGTKPIFTILLLLGSAPAALYLTFWVAMRSIKNLTPPTPPSPTRSRAGGEGQALPQKEEDDSE